MSEWKQYKLGNVAELINGFAFKSADFSGCGTPIVKIKNVASGRFTFNDIQYYPNEIIGRLKQFVLKKGDILIAMTGSHVHQQSSMVGKVTRYDKSFPALLNQRVGKIVSKNSNILCEDFIYYFLKQEEVTVDLAVNAGGSANQANISAEQIKDLPIILPPISEQRTIADLLSSLDDKIDLLHQQNKTLESIAAALWRKMFVEEADPMWKIATIGEVATINGKSIYRNYPFASIEYLDTGSITEGKISDFQYIPFKDAPSRARRVVKKNDIIISMVRPIQKHYGLLKKVNSNTIVSTGFVVITCIEIDPHFIYLLLTQEDMTEFLEIIAEGSTTTYPSLVPSDIERIDFQRPPAELMKQFSEYASCTWDKIEENHLQIYKLSCLRDNLLPKLMSGEVEVKEIEK